MDAVYCLRGGDSVSQHNGSPDRLVRLRYWDNCASKTTNCTRDAGDLIVGLQFMDRNQSFV